MDFLQLLFTDYTLRTVALGAAALGIVSGALGTFATLRRQSLLGDAMSHAALPGVVIAFMLTGTKSPLVLMLGAAAAGILGTLLMMAITRNTRIKEDSTLGLILSVFFGFGLMLLTFLQKNPDSIYLEIEDDLYPRFPGLLTPSKAMIYAVLNSYAEKDRSAWRLRPEDVANARRTELNTITAMLEAVGKRLNYTTQKKDKNYLWEDAAEDGGKRKVTRAFYILASALIGRAMNETPYPPEQTIIVIPGGRASLVAYKAQRDPSLAARMKKYQLVKYRLLRTLFEVPVLTRETFEEQIASDPLEKSKSQMIMF